MEELTTIWTSLEEYLASLYTITFWIQFALLAIFALVAGFIKRYWSIKFMTDADELKGPRKYLLNAVNKAVFPLSMMLMAMLARAVMHAFELTTIILSIAIPLLFSMGLIRLAVYTLRKGFTPSPAVKAMENLIVTIVWCAVALHIVGWLEPIREAMDSLAMNLGHTRVSVWSGFKLILSLGILLILALWLSKSIENRLKKSPYLDPGMRAGLAKVTHFILIILAGLLALNIVGINLTALHVFSGAVGVGLGFGLQKIASNFVSGFILIFDRSIKPGDVISIDNKMGWIEEMRARYVVMKNREGVDTLIPNESLITSQVINWSYDDYNVRVKLPVQVSYDDDPEHAMELMLQVARNNKRVLKDPAPACRLLAFGDNGIDLELRVWINDPHMGTGNLRSDINVGIWRIFKEHNITIPYPQRDLYLKSMPAGTG